MRRVLATLAATTVVTLTMAACGGGSDPLGNGAGGGSAAPSDTIRIGSANFTESTLLAEIYAQALEAKGVTVERHLNLGSRETYIPALKDGSIDLIPEYSGNLLQYLDRSAPQTAPADVYAALLKTVPAPLTVLDESDAQDKDSVVVSRGLAQRDHLASIPDLAPHCGELTFGGSSEFQARLDGIPGLRKNYGCSFRSYLALDAGGPLTLSALKGDKVQAADVFTTDPSVETDDLVALADPKNNFAAQNVLPLINSSKVTDEVKQELDAVSAKLTTQSLVDLNRQLNAPDKPDPAAVAKGWLSRSGLG
jgi:osmoprotectant transport system substrate-binding protein